MRGQGRGFCGAAVLALVAGNPALAQDAGGLRLTFGITERLEASDNAQLADPSSGRLTSSTTSLSFGLTSETQTQVLRLGFSGGLKFEEGAAAAEPDRFDNPSLEVFYSLAGPNSAMVLQGNADRSPLSFAEPTNDDPDPSGTGTRLRHSASAKLDLGIAGPLGLTLEASHSGSDFTGSEQADTATLTYSATGHLRFSSGAAARITASKSDFTEDNLLDLNRQTTDLSLGWTQPLSPVLVLDASVGQQRVDTLLLGVLVDRTEGLSGKFGLTMDLANGQAGLSLAQDNEPGATRQTLKAERNFDLGNQTIALSLGATRQDEGEANVIGGLRWSYDAQVGAASLDYSRTVESGGLGSEVTTDRLALGLSREIDPSNRLGLDLAAARIDDSDASLVERMDLTLRYDRDLGQDWQMSLGASLTRRAEGAEPSATSRQVFISLTRSFDWRP